MFEGHQFVPPRCLRRIRMRRSTWAKATPRKTGRDRRSFAEGVKDDRCLSVLHSAKAIGATWTKVTSRKVRKSRRRFAEGAEGHRWLCPCCLRKSPRST